MQGRGALGTRPALDVFTGHSRQIVVNELVKGKVPIGPCCFCGEHIVPNSMDPCRLTVETSASRWQIWYCHDRCFHERLALRVDVARNGAQAP
jgi:hypothetical protein